MLVLNVSGARPGSDEQTTKYMAPGCHFVECCLNVRFVNIEYYSPQLGDSLARTDMYKGSMANLSRIFWRTFPNRSNGLFLKPCGDYKIELFIQYGPDIRVAQQSI